MKQLWAPWRMAYVSGDEPPGDGCLFCTMASDGDDVAHLVVERADLTFTVLNRFPYSSGHVMVVPMRHVTDVGSLTDDEGAALTRGVARATAALTDAMGAEGFNVGVNLGEAAGASIDHIHLHVVPRWKGDTNFMPVLADVKVLPDHLERTAGQLRTALETP